MDAQDFRSLQEAYLEVYQEQELDEAITSEKGKAKAAAMIAARSTPSGRAKSGQGANVALIKHIGRSNREGLGLTPPNRKTAGSNRPKSYSGIGGTGNKAERRAAALKKEQVDIYDIILSHLLDEGYAETPEAAEVIMVNMSEEWRDSICEELTGERKNRALKKGYKDLANAKEGSSATRNADRNMPTRRGGSSGLRRNPNRWGRPGSIEPGQGVLKKFDSDRGGGHRAKRRMGKKVKDNLDRYYHNDSSPDF